MRSESADTRRTFLRNSALGFGTILLGGPGRGRAAAGPASYRAAVIGRTGRGDYGHGYDRIFSGLENVTVEAVADEDAEGLKKAAASSGARRTYRDYREMLQREKPDLVSIAPRQPDCHREMALAAIEVCRGFFIEKPLTETVADADAILEAATRRNVKIVVAHNRRYTPEFVQTKALLDQRAIGEVRQVRIQGKQDSRVGGEDMIVLGTHDFDLMRLYFGDPRWCVSSVAAGGKDITRSDVRQGREPIVVAGDTVHALFGFPDNIVVHWSSVKTRDGWNASTPPVGDKWAFEICGTRGILAYRSGYGFAWLESPYIASKDAAGTWKDLPKPERWDWPEHARHPIRSLVRAIETNSATVCSGEDGRWAVEMVAAVYESQRTGARVNFPLKDRSNPLLRF